LPPAPPTTKRSSAPEPDAARFPPCLVTPRARWGTDMLNVRRLIVVIVLCLAAARADAQTSPDVRERFVDVSLGPDWDDAHSFSTRVPGATWRSGFAFGVDRERSGVEVDVSVPQWHVQNQPPLRYRYAGTTVGWEQQGHSYEWSATVRRRSTDATLLY